MPSAEWPPDSPIGRGAPEEPSVLGGVTARDAERRGVTVCFPPRARRRGHRDADSDAVTGPPAGSMLAVPPGADPRRVRATRAYTDSRPTERGVSPSLVRGRYDFLGGLDVVTPLLHAHASPLPV